MVEEKRLQIWQITQTIIGGLVVASLIGLASSLFALRDAVLKHDVLLEQFDQFRNAGNRYTAKDGRIERDSRIQADAVMSEKIESMNANQQRMWKSIRRHIEQGQHQGADFRLKALEKYMEKDK